MSNENVQSSIVHVQSSMNKELFFKNNPDDRAPVYY